MSHQKRTLIAIAKKVLHKKPLTPDEVSSLLGFEKVDKETTLTKRLKQIAVPAALSFGFLFSALPGQFTELVKQMPAWTNFSPPIFCGIFLVTQLKKQIFSTIPPILLFTPLVFLVSKN
jgi:hypothetical protein